MFKFSVRRKWRSSAESQLAEAGSGDHVAGFIAGDAVGSLRVVEDRRRSEGGGIEPVVGAARPPGRWGLAIRSGRSVPFDCVPLSAVESTAVSGWPV